MKIMIFIVSMLFCSSSYLIAQIKYHISGLIYNDDVQKIYIVHDLVKIDSAVVKNGIFELSGIRDTPIVAVFLIKTQNHMMAQKLILDDGEYHIKIDSNLNCSIETNSVNYNLWDKFTSGNIIKNNKKEKDSLLSEFKSKINNGIYNLGNLYSEKNKKIKIKLLETYKQLVTDHPDYYITPYLLHNSGILTYANFSSTFNLLAPQVKNNEWGVILNKEMDDNIKSKPDKYDVYYYLIGSKSLPVDSKFPDGKDFSLASLKGKWILLDFWASWCGPCRAEIPNIKREYAKYKDKNLVVAAISTDRDKNAWLQAVKQGQTSMFIHTNIADIYKSKAYKNYQADVVPWNFLINPEGIIVAMDIRGEELTKVLAQYIK